MSDNAYTQHVVSVNMAVVLTSYVTRNHISELIISDHLCEKMTVNLSLNVDNIFKIQIALID